MAWNPVAHVGRNPEIVRFSDRDVIAFIPDRIRDTVLGATMKIYDVSGGTELYALDGAMPQAPDRVLLYGRISSGGELETGLRMVPYINNDDPEVDQIRILKEVISPRVIYDATSNILSLWFWTNFSSIPPGGAYDETYVEIINEEAFEVEATHHRVLCFAVGTVEHVYIEGALIGGTGGTENTYDLIPIFTKPQIVQIRDIRQGGTGPYAGGTGLTGFIPIVDFGVPGEVAGTINVKNMSGETAPAGAFIETYQYDSGTDTYYFRKPTVDFADNIYILTTELADEETGTAWERGITANAFMLVSPTPGDYIGSIEGEWYGAINAEGGFVAVAPEGSSV
jgi:hypothetical protein